MFKCSKELAVYFENTTLRAAEKFSIYDGVNVEKVILGKSSPNTQKQERFVIIKLHGKAIKSKNQFVNI